MLFSPILGETEKLKENKIEGMLFQAVIRL